MNHGKMTIVAIAAAAGLDDRHLAQDSVSQLPGTFVGDALIPWEVSSQCTNFVVDLAPITTSGGTTFGVAPLVKSSKSSTEFFSSLLSAQSVSATELVVDEFAAPEYYFWDFPGGGVNFFENGGKAPNAMGTLVTPTAEGEIYQFAASAGEFAFTDSGANYEGHLGAVVNYDKANPSRLYVTRVMGATNRVDPFATPSAAFGSGTVDANGNQYFRADDFGGVVGITGNNIFRVSLLDRDCSVVNRIGATGGADASASDWIVQNSGLVHSVPGNIPQDVAGRPVYVGYTFGTQLARESAPLVVTRDDSHLDGLASDHRGNIATYRADALNAGGVATGAVLSKSLAGGGSTDSISLFSMDAGGNPIAGSQQIFTIPSAALTDPLDGYTLSNNGLYEHYRSQTAFRGGNGPCAIGVDADGNVLFAGVTHLTGGASDPFNAMPVGRLNPSTGDVDYTLAAWVDIDPAGPSGVSGKPVYDGSGAVIGQLRPFIELDPTRTGPSMSAPAFDGVGNVWFVGLVAFEDGGEPLRTTLIRGVLEDLPDGSFGYRLEKVLAFGDVIPSQNTGLNYSIGGFQIADADSVNSGTLWSSNVKQSTWGGTPVSELESNADPRSTAGVVVATSITYDVDGDGEYSLDPGSLDEAYNVLMYVSNFEKAVNNCPQDLDGNGVVGAGDLAILVGTWGQVGGPADFNGNGVGPDDLALVIGAWGPCPE